MKSTRCERRIVKTDGGGGRLVALTGPPPLDPSGLLTVTAADGVNRLFYLQPDSSGGSSRMFAMNLALNCSNMLAKVCSFARMLCEVVRHD